MSDLATANIDTRPHTTPPKGRVVFAVGALLCGCIVAFVFHVLEIYHLFHFHYPVDELALPVFLPTITTLGTFGSLLILRSPLARRMSWLRMFGLGVAATGIGAALSGLLAVAWMLCSSPWPSGPDLGPAAFAIPAMCLTFAVLNAPFVLPLAMLIVKTMNWVAMGKRSRDAERRLP